MKQIFTSFILILSLNIFAQSDADLLKMQRDPMNQIRELGLLQSRDGEIGFNCATAIPVVSANSSFQGLFNNGSAEQGPNYVCLISQPNPTWFKFSVTEQVTVQITMTSTPMLDIDFILYGVAPGSGCTGVYSAANIINCSYSTMATETHIGMLIPELDYYLLITNFSNQPCVINLAFQALNGNLNFQAGDAFIFTGNVYNDQNANCVYDGGETAVGSGSVHALGTVLSVPVLADGSYSLALPSYNNQQFTYSLNNSYSLNFTDCNDQPLAWTYNAPGFGIYNYDVGIIGTDCALPAINTFSPFARRCFTNGRNVNYGNYGNQPLLNASVKLTYDLNEVLPVSFSVPFTQNGNEFTVQVGDLAPFQSGNFYVLDSLRCENGIGSSVSVTAQIFPIPDCLPSPNDWDQSDLITYVACSTDNIEFQVQNIGSGSMATAVDAVLYANSTPIDTVSIQLTTGQSTSVNIPSQSNTTYTLVVPETANNPFNQTSWASGECYGGEIFTGIPPFLMPQDQQPYLDQDIQVVIGAYDPNDKNAIPFGLTDNKYILKTDDLEYTIRFQNTGSDTAFNVVVIDEFLAELDPATFQLIGTSHPYNYMIQGNKLTIQFPNILLPDSASNPEGSIGYFVFKIKQINNPLEAYFVDNEAKIYFDFNEPITTNLCRREVAPKLPLSIKVSNPTAFSVYPNPTNQILNIVLENAQPKFTYNITDLQGRIILSGQSQNNSLVGVDVSNLSHGSYLIAISNELGKTVKKFIKM